MRKLDDISDYVFNKLSENCEVKSVVVSENKRLRYISISARLKGNGRYSCGYNSNIPYQDIADRFVDDLSNRLGWSERIE